MIIAYGKKENINFFDYIKNRLARIYPAYFLAIFLSVAVLSFKNFNHNNFILNILMVQSWFSKRELTINAPGWSLSVELAFYLLFPLLLNKIYSKFSFKTNFIWITLFWLLSQIICVLINNEILKIPFYTANDFYYNPILHINEFLTGNLAGLFFLKNYKKLQGNNLVIILILFAAFLLLLKYHGVLILRNGFLAVVFVPLICIWLITK